MIRTLPNVSRLASGLKLWVSINSLIPFRDHGKGGGGTRPLFSRLSVFVSLLFCSTGVQHSAV